MPGPDPFVVQFSDLLGDRRGRKVLDCGQGAGRNSLYLAERGHQVTGIDLSASMLGRSRTEQRGDGIVRVRGALQRLPFQDGVFDAVVCTHTLETMRLPQIMEAVAEFPRVLRPGGLLLIVTGAREDSDTTGGRELEPGTFAFNREGRIFVHLADRTELGTWTSGFATVARYFLKLEEPRSKPFCAQWAFMGQRS